MTAEYLSGSGSVYKCLDEIEALIVSDMVNDMYRIIKEMGAQLLQKLFYTNPFDDEIIRNSYTYRKTIAIIVSYSSRILALAYLAPLYNVVNFIHYPEPQQILVQILESYCRSMYMHAVYTFPSPPPVKELMDYFVAKFQLSDTPDATIQLHMLQTLLIFNYAKYIFADNRGFELFASYLATADEADLIRNLLNLFHAVIFNITDTNSLFYEIMDQFVEINPSQLIGTVLEKKNYINTIRFDVLMFLNGSLQPQSIQLVNRYIFEFFIHSFGIISNKDFVVGQDGVIQGVNTLFNEYYDILLQNMIKYFSIASDPVKQEFISVLLDTNAQEYFGTFLNRSVSHENNHMLVSFLQLCVSNSTTIDNLKDNKLYQKLRMLRAPLFRYAIKLSTQMLKQDLRQVLQEVEDCCSVLVFVSLDFYQGSNGAIDELISMPECAYFVGLVLTLAHVDYLINTTPAIASLFSLLCKSGSALLLYKNYAYRLRGEEAGGVSKSVASLLLYLQKSPNSQIVVFNILGGLCGKNKDILRMFAEDDFIYILQSFRDSGAEEYDDLLVGLVDCYGKNERIVAAVESIVSQ